MSAAPGVDDRGNGAAPPGARFGPRTRAGLAVGAVLPAAAGVALWAAARSSTAAVVTVVAVLQALTIVTWVLGRRVPGRAGALGITALVAAAVDVLAVRFPDGRLGVLLPPVGLVLLAVFVAQLARGVVRWRVVESVSDIALVTLAVVGLGTLVPLRHGLTGDAQLRTVALVLGVALAAGALVDLVAPVPRFDPAVDRGLAGVVVGAAAGGVVGYLQLHHTLGYGPVRGAVLGAALGAVAGLVAVGAAFARHRPPAPSVPEGADPDPSTDPDVAVDPDPGADPAVGAEPEPEPEPDPDAEIVAEFADPAPAPAAGRAAARWSERAQDAATTLWAVAVTAPVGYLITLALGG